MTCSMKIFQKNKSEIPNGIFVALPSIKLFIKIQKGGNYGTHNKK